MEGGFLCLPLSHHSQSSGAVRAGAGGRRQELEAGAGGRSWRQELEAGDRRWGPELEAGGGAEAREEAAR